MTKEDFKEVIEEALEDMKDPSGDFNTAITESKGFVSEIWAHDPVLADKINTFMANLEDIGNYIRTKAEERK